jgi:peroxiredoxin Q/BCP
MTGEPDTIARMTVSSLFKWGASITLGVAAGLVGFAQPAAELKVGDEAPAFTLQGSDGKTYSLAQFKGRSAVVLAWFPKAFTGG